MSLNLLIDVLAPYLEEGIKSIFSNVAKKNITQDILISCFKRKLLSISEWSDKTIIDETKRIIEIAPKGGLIQPLLIRSMNDLAKEFDTMLSKQELEINMKEYIRACYVNIGKYLYVNPYLLQTESLSSYEIAIQTREVYNIIEKSIKSEIYYLLPLKRILNTQDRYGQLKSSLKSSERYDNSKNNIIATESTLIL